MLTKWIGFGEEDSDEVMAQEGQFVDFWDDCGGLVPPPLGVHWWTLQPAFFYQLLIKDLLVNEFAEYVDTRSILAEKAN
jgi:hypothetical protein